MKDAPKPKCPKCGRSDTKCIGVEPIYDSKDRERRKPIARILSFKCPCGNKFTEKVKEPT